MLASMAILGLFSGLRAAEPAQPLEQNTTAAQHSPKNTDTVFSILEQATPQPTATLQTVTIAANSSPTLLNATTIATLAPMTVSADSHHRQLAATQSLAIIKPAAWEGTGKNIADVIAELPGVQTRRYGGTGSFQTVSIRGIQGSNVLVLLDGIPLNSAMGGAVDLGKINPQLLQEIAVYKGITPGIFGGNSIGGIINLKSKRATDEKRYTIATEIGSYGKQRLNTAFSCPINKSLYVTTGGSYIHSANDFPYLDRNHTTWGPTDGSTHDPRNDDTLRTLKNNQYTAADLFVNTRMATSRSRELTTGIAATTLTTHIPAPEGKVNETAQYTEKRIQGHVIYSSTKPESNFSVTPRLGYSFTDGLTVWSDLDQGFGSSHGGVHKYGHAGIQDQNLSGDVALQYGFSDMIKLSASVFSRGSNATPQYNRDGIAGDWQSRRAEGGAALDLALSSGIFEALLSGSGKAVYDETEGGIESIAKETVPASDTITKIWATTAGIACKPSKQVTIFCNGGRYSNEPTLRERYGARGAIMANPALVPEIGYSSETGIKLTTHHLFLQLTTFFIESRNTIVFSSDGFQRKPINIKGATLQGIELSSETTVTEALKVDLSGTWQKTVNHAPLYESNRMPDEPDLSLIGYITYSPANYCNLRYGISYKSFYFHTPSEDMEFRVPAKTVTGKLRYGNAYHSIAVTWHPTRSLTCKLSGNALTPSILPGNAAPVIEGGYSWTLYPSNEWCFSTSYSF